MSLVIAERSVAGVSVRPVGLNAVSSIHQVQMHGCVLIARVPQAYYVAENATPRNVPTEKAFVSAVHLENRHVYLLAI